MEDAGGTNTIKAEFSGLFTKIKKRTERLEIFFVMSTAALRNLRTQ